jgi:hypothetical protein
MKTLILFMAAAMLLLSSQTFAGAFHVAPVEIDFDKKTARGNLIAARASESPHERIGCAVGYGYLLGHYAYCEATDADENAIKCITYDPDMIDTIASINTFSFVYYAWEEGHSVPEGFELCTHVTVATRSIHIPEKIELEMELESFDSTKKIPLG